MHRQDGKLGATGLEVSRLGLGLAALGRPGYINLGHSEDLQGEYDPSAMEQRAHAVLDAAWGGGIRYFDTARSYGRGEEFLASWLSRRGITPETITVGSKWGYTYTAAWQVQAEAHEIKEHSLPVLRRQWAESDSILGKQLDLYQVHSATLESGVLENIDLLNELVRMKSSGLHIGLSITGTSQAETLRRAIEITIDGAAVFEAVQATWNLFEPSAGAALAEAHAAGMGVIIKEALANGRLTGRNRAEEDAEDLKVLRQEALKLNASIDSLVLAVTLAQPFVDVVLSGASTSEQVRSNLTSTDLKLDGSIPREFKNFAKPPEFYWEQRKRLEWN